MAFGTFLLSCVSYFIILTPTFTTIIFTATFDSDRLLMILTVIVIPFTLKVRRKLQLVFLSADYWHIICAIARLLFVAINFLILLLTVSIFFFEQALRTSLHLHQFVLYCLVLIVYE